jgi:hypothetical protein
MSKTIIKRETERSCTLLNPDKRCSGVSSKMNCGSKLALKKKMKMNFTNRYIDKNMKKQFGKSHKRL